jgi:hypothetical protein
MQHNHQPKVKGMDRRWGIRTAVAATIVTALLCRLLSRKSRSTEAGSPAAAPTPPSLTQDSSEAGSAPSNRAHAPAGTASGNPTMGRTPPAVDEDLMVEETMPESPGDTGTATAGGFGLDEPVPADVDDAAAEQAAVTDKPLYDETEWLGYAGEAVIEPSVEAEDGDGADRKRG